MERQRRAAHGAEEEEEEADGLSGAALAQWKRARLAQHHAYFALLDKAFTRWRQVARARQQRRQRVVAACLVGARFFQRLYWDEWTAMVERRRAAREAASRLLRSVSRKIRLRAAWVKWAEATAASGRIRREAAGPVGRMVAERRLEVRGVRLLENASRVITGGSRASPALATAIPEKARIDRAESLKKITVYYTQRHYFQLWREAAQAVGKMISKQLRDSADAFRVRSALTRWRRGFTTRSEYKLASRQAVFFLYYHLTKSSMTQLRLFAARQRHERGVSVVLSNRVRRRRLASAYSRWRQRLNVKLIFSQWRDVVSQSSRNHSNPQLRAIHGIVRELEENRVLRRAFALWFEQSTSRRRSRALMRLLDGPVSKIAMASAFRTWQHQTATKNQLRSRVQSRDRDRLLRVWQSWKQFAKVKAHHATQRCVAVRFYYCRTLRSAFTALQALRTRRQDIEAAIGVLAQDTLFRRKRVTFVQWVQWCARRRQRREAAVVVQECHAVGMKKRAFRTLRLNLEDSQVREQRAVRHADKLSLKVLQGAFGTWKTQLIHEQRRNDDLAVRLASFLHARATRTKILALRAMDSYAKSKHSRRLLNAHARGQFQSKLLRISLSTWVSAVAQLKWEHIFNQRAQHFRIQKLSRKCFSKWMTNARAIKQYRENVRRALHHWKHVREREAFEGWKRYVAARRLQRERMHGALEFRHRAHIRDGLSQWIAGATHLTSERSRRTVEMQATHTKQLWRKVREIAIHWRFITLRNKARTTVQVQQDGRVRRTTIPSAFTDERTDVDPLRRERALPAAAVTRVRRHQEPAGLSEFVMLPRNRPRPRKPIELIVESDLPVVGMSGDAYNSDIHAENPSALGNVNRLYGFQFPPVVTDIMNRPCDSETSAQDTNCDRDDELKEIERTPPTHEPTIDELEERLLQWRNRRQRLKELQHALEDFRRLLYEAVTQGNVHQDELDIMTSRLRTMEQQEAASRRRWNESRPEIQSVAQRIRLLRGVMTASA